MMDYTEEALRGRGYFALSRSNGHTWREHLNIAEKAGLAGDETARANHLDEAAAAYVATVQRLSWSTERRFAFCTADRLREASGVTDDRLMQEFMAKSMSIMVSIVPNMAGIAETRDPALVSTVYLNAAASLPFGTGAVFLLHNKAIGKVKSSVTPPSALKYHCKPKEPLSESQLLEFAGQYFSTLGHMMRGGEISYSEEEKALSVVSFRYLEDAIREASLLSQDASLHLAGNGVQMSL